MSRIHDALKKAQQEHLAQTGSNGNALSADVATGLSDSVRLAVPGKPPTSPRNSESTDTPFPPFQEVLKRCSHPTWKLDPTMSVFEDGQINRAGAETFRTLRSRLYQVAAARMLRRVIVTSSVAGEGKTFVASNLSQSIARQADRRVLLIDADLRAPRLHVALGAPQSPGLSEYLCGAVDEYSIIQKGLSSGLCLIPSGSKVSNPGELILGNRIKRLLEVVTPVFDWVILDSPPVLPVHDASLLADLCDGVLYVVRAGATDFELVAKGSSEFRNKAIVGVVLNRVDQSESYGGDYYNNAGTTPDAPLAGT